MAERLDLDPERVFPAYEDAFYYLWREQKLPINVDPLTSRLDDPLERARLRRHFSTGLEQPIGHVLPIARRATGFRTGPWHLRDERCYLIPGDSPLGLRLPLASQPWLAEDDRVPFFPPDQGQVFTPLPTHTELRNQYAPSPEMSVALLEIKAKPSEPAPEGASAEEAAPTGAASEPA